MYFFSRGRLQFMTYVLHNNHWQVQPHLCLWIQTSTIDDKTPDTIPEGSKSMKRYLML